MRWCYKDDQLLFWNSGELQLFYRQTYKISKLGSFRATRKFQYFCLFTGFSLSQYQNNKCQRHEKGGKSCFVFAGQQNCKAILTFFFFFFKRMSMIPFLPCTETSMTDFSY